MRDRTEEVRAIVGKYPGFSFTPLRIEDAFDKDWWARVGGKQFGSNLGVDTSNEGTMILKRRPRPSLMIYKSSAFQPYSKLSRAKAR